MPHEEGFFTEYMGNQRPEVGNSTDTGAFQQTSVEPKAEDDIEQLRVEIARLRAEHEEFQTLKAENVRLTAENEEMKKLQTADREEIQRLQEENCYLLTELVTVEGQAADAAEPIPGERGKLHPRAPSCMLSFTRQHSRLKEHDDFRRIVLNIRRIALNIHRIALNIRRIALNIHRWCRRCSPARVVPCVPRQYHRRGALSAGEGCRCKLAQPQGFRADRVEDCMRERVPTGGEGPAGPSVEVGCGCKPG
eukprot:5212560-Pyramimonas_sp.AAC.1